MTSRLVRVATVATFFPVLLLAGSRVALTQGSTGEVRGTAQGTDGGPVTVGVVTVQNQDTGWSAQATVDERGEFAFRQVPPGTYRIEVLAPRFQKYRSDDVVVADGRAAAVNARLEPGTVTGVAAALGGGHVVLGYGWNEVADGNWSHTYAVLVTPRGRVIGNVRVSFVYYPDPQFSVDYTNDVDCVEIDAATRSAWLGGRISKTSNPGYIPLDTYMVDFARDGGPGHDGDLHGDAIPGWDGQPETCHERYGPYFMDPVQRGDVFVR